MITLEPSTTYQIMLKNLQDSSSRMFSPSINVVHTGTLQQLSTLEKPNGIQLLNLNCSGKVRIFKLVLSWLKLGTYSNIIHVRYLCFLLFELRQDIGQLQNDHKYMFALSVSAFEVINYHTQLQHIANVGFCCKNTSL